MVIKSSHLIVALVGVSAVLVGFELPAETVFGMGTVSLVSGVAALVLMAAASVLGARWSLVESWFRGLDRVYKVHKWLGVWALGLASVHLVLRAGAQGWEMATILALPGSWTRFLRQFSFVGLMLIVLLALNRNILYSQWRLWHKLSGPLFVVVVLHWLSIRQPIVLASPAGIWLALWSVLGIGAAFYKLFLFRFLAPHAEYQVVALHQTESGLHLQLEPVGQGIYFTPGQFGFLHIHADGLREPHPFTIASGSGGNGRVDFVIRPLGDFTRKLLADARIGMHATVHAPFGRFERNRAARREVWIGGGVGISPFIAWLHDAEAGGFDKVTLFYFYTPGREFPPVSVIEAMAHERGVELVPVSGGPGDPAFAERFSEICRANPTGVDVAFCGPQGLMTQVSARMRDNGVPDANLRHEFFEFR